MFRWGQALYQIRALHNLRPAPALVHLVLPLLRPLVTPLHKSAPPLALRFYQGDLSQLATVARRLRLLWKQRLVFRILRVRQNFPRRLVPSCSLRNLLRRTPAQSAWQSFNRTRQFIPTPLHPNHLIDLCVDHVLSSAAARKVTARPAVGLSSF